MSNNNHKVKGLLKGLRYISQIFDNEKKQEIQIGFPTDVKHVAHIGWDGPSVNSPSWMNEFKSSQPPNGEMMTNQTNNSVKWAPEDTSRKTSRSTNAHKKRELPDLPKTSRRQSTESIAGSPANEKSEKSKQPIKSSKPKDSSDGSKSTQVPVDLPQSDSPARSQPDVPKKSQRKKSKDENVSTRSRLKALATDLHSGHGSPAGPSFKFKNKQKSFDDDGCSEKESTGIS